MIHVDVCHTLLSSIKDHSRILNTGIFKGLNNNIIGMDPILIKDVYTDMMKKCRSESCQEDNGVNMSERHRDLQGGD